MSMPKQLSDFITSFRAIGSCFSRICKWSDYLQMSLQSVVEWSINPSIKETIAMQCVIHPKILLANQTGRAQKTCSCKKFWVLRSELENGFLIRADSDRERDGEVYGVSLVVGHKFNCKQENESQFGWMLILLLSIAEEVFGISWSCL